MCNGCWPSWIKIVPCEFKACNWHDLAYKKGGNSFDRYIVDRIFLEDMLTERPSRQICIYVYYYLVRTFWWIFYKNKQEG